MTRIRHLPLVLAVAQVLALPVVWAQESPAAQVEGRSTDTRHEEPAELDRVVVTASPLRQSAEDLSQPAEILSGEKLDEAKAATLGETLGRLPGVQSSNFGAGVGRPVIRGLEGPRVSLLSGGMATQDVSTISQDHAVAVEPFLADQIEVLKGPATLLYGSGAIGGVVNVVDGRIAESALGEPLRGRAEARLDSVNEGRTGMFRVDAQGADGALVLHADGVYRDQDDYDTPLGVQRNSFVRTRTGAVGASLVGAEGFVGASIARYDNRYGNPGEPGDPVTGDPGVSLDMLQDRFEMKAGLDRDFGIFTALRAGFAHTAYQHTEFEGSEVGTVFTNDADEGRLELTHRALGPWIGAIGAQVSDRTFEAIGEEAFVPRTHTRAYGVFVTEQAKWNAWQVDLGARVDRLETDPASAASLRFTPVSLSAGLLWRLDDAWRLSFNLDRAERAPAEEELFADGPHVATASYEIGDARLTKERANQAEVGLHYHGQRWEAKASVYYTRFDGFIYLLDSGAFTPAEPGEDPLPVRQWTQADARFRGAEAEVIGHLLDSDRGALDLRIFGDRVRAQLDAGSDLPRIAPSRLGADLRWKADQWRASMGAVHYARQDDVAAGETPTAGYTLVDAHLAYHWDVGGLGWEAFLDGTNLTDETARVHTSFLKDRVALPGRGVAAGVRVFF